MTGSIRLYLDMPLATAGTVATNAAQAHYLGSVMRCRTGDPVRLFNGRDGEFLACLATIGRDRAELTVERQLRAQAAGPDLWLAFAALKRDATDLVVQKATELGSAALLPVITERTNTRRINRARLTSIAIEAAEQSERLTLPEVHAPLSLHELLGTWPKDRRLFVAVERTNGPHLPPARGATGLLVGPEGGFSPAELDAMRSNPFVSPISLGPNILRAETACIAGLALLQAATRA